MKIEGSKASENHDVFLKTQKADPKNIKAKTDQDGTPVITDRVNLSGKAKEIANLKNAVTQLPDIRTDKVQEIEKAIKNGTYKIDSLKIAGKIIDEIV